MQSGSCLQTREFLAYIADNAPVGIHRGGYNGLASLITRRTGNNLFVPSYAGLNYETIWLAGLSQYTHDSGSKFEPRCEPMRVDSVDEHRVVLVQPETAHAHVSARITFRVEEPHYLHQHIELVFHRRFCADDEQNSFHSLWASYIHMPPDRHIYTQLDGAASALADWVGITKEDHSAKELLVRPLPNDRELQAAEHLGVMMSSQPATAEPVLPSALAPMELPARLGGPLRFYYGFCHDDQLLLKMFKQPERFRLAYSPNGGGKLPEWSPAWDFVLHLEDAQLERTYSWDLCLVVKAYRGRADVLNEIRRYQSLG